MVPVTEKSKNIILHGIWIVKHISDNMILHLINSILFQGKKVTNITATEGKVFASRALVAVGNGNGLAGSLFSFSSVAIWPLPFRGEMWPSPGPFVFL